MTDRISFNDSDAKGLFASYYKDISKENEEKEESEQFEPSEAKLSLTFSQPHILGPVVLKSDYLSLLAEASSTIMAQSILIDKYEKEIARLLFELQHHFNDEKAKESILSNISKDTVTDIVNQNED